MAVENDAITVATASLRDAVTALEAEEKRVSAELADVKSKLAATSKALEALSGERPRRRRGRPRNVEAVAA